MARIGDSVRAGVRLEVRLLCDYSNRTVATFSFWICPNEKGKK